MHGYIIAIMRQSFSFMCLLHISIEQPGATLFCGISLKNPSTKLHSYEIVVHVYFVVKYIWLHAASPSTG